MSVSTDPALPPKPPRSMGRPKGVAVRKLSEGTIVGLLAICGLFTLLITVGIIYALSRDSYHFFAGIPGRFEGVPISEFLFSTHWSPLLGSEKHFGVWPLVVGTLMVTLIAVLVAGPLGLITAIWLGEYAPTKIRNVLKPVLEILAGVPTVVLGFFALTVITPTLRFDFWQVPVVDPSGKVMVDAAGKAMTQAANPLGIDGYNVLAAGIAVGILTLPIVTSLSEDALRAVPRSLREASYGVGATRFETSLRVVFPAALSGIIAALLLAVARCVGETMIVALAAGGRHLPLNYLTDPPLVVHNWVQNGNAADGKPMAQLEASKPYNTDLFRIKDAEKVDEIDFTLLPDTTARTFTAELLDAGGKSLATGSVTLTDEQVKSSARVSATFPPARLVTATSNKPAEQAKPFGVALPAGDYRIRLAPTDGSANLSWYAVDGERFMPLVERAAIPVDVRQSMQPMTGYLVQIFMGDVSNLGIEYYSSYAVAALLFLITLVLTLVGQLIRVRYQQKYE
jgi:phosphate transport system permease protein